ncbi:MAG: nucleotidyltransferase domain-containing protein [Acholeplasma sp.]|jgi:predicted nucleotidyltransferase|nr:nucleotidyltransferase domain-containing protein [Acholeplasma sp.]
MNMIEAYKKTANKYIEKLQLNPDVVGIMHLGGIARNYADEHSDIDIAVFSKKPLNIKLGEQLTEEGYDLEIFNVVMEESPEHWGSIQKEAYQEGFIVYDVEGQTKMFIDKVLEYNEIFRQKEILRLVFKIAWHGWIYSPFRNQNRQGYNWILPEDLWFQRGKIYNAYYIAQVCIFDFIELLFVINRKWTPDYKWRLIKSLQLDYVPKDYEKNVNFLIQEAWNENTWSLKRDVFQKMIDEVIEKVIPDLPEDWYGALSHD